MTELSTFRRNSKAMRDGEWVSPGAEYGDFQLKCRALGFEYLDRVAAERKRAARAYGGDEERIPSELRAKINTDAMIELALIDVRGLSDGGKQVDFDRFCELVRDPQYGELSSAAFQCCGMVGRTQAEEVKEATGNFAAPSEAN